MRSIAFLCGMPQGAAGPESGVEIPNLMASAARPPPGFETSNAAAPRSAAQFGVNLALIFFAPQSRLCLKKPHLEATEGGTPASIGALGSAWFKLGSPEPFVDPVSDECNRR